MIKLVDLERRLVSTTLTFPEDTLAIVSDLVSGSEFEDEQLGMIFDAVREMFFRTGSVDQIQLARKLKTAGVTMAQIAELIRDATTTTFAESDAVAIEESSRRRKLSAIFDAARTAIRATDEAVSDSVDSVIRKIAEVGTGRVSNLTHIAPIAEGIVDRLKRRACGEITTEPQAVSTGIYSLDAALGGGFRPSELIILAARPGLGKTALAVNIADFVSMTCGRPTLFVSLEMTQHEITERFLALRSKVRGLRIRNEHISNEETQLLDASLSRFSSSGLHIDDSASMTIQAIENASRRLASSSGLDFVIVDYLQLITSSNSRASRAEQVTEISRRLKIMARTLKVPVLCLAQLNRQSEAGGDKRPRKSQLRESGSIEQDADSVLLLHREDEESSLNTLIIDKNRHGPCCDIPLLVQPACFRFQELLTAGAY